MFEDKVLVCRDCGKEFIFTGSEQEFFAEKGFVNEPKRCKPCRDIRRENHGGKVREMHEAICGDCGRTTEVPFKPVTERPVYCQECFERHKQ